MFTRKTMRVWFKDGTYIDLYKHEVKDFESQPDWDRTEDLDKSDPEEDEVPL